MHGLRSALPTLPQRWRPNRWRQHIWVLDDPSGPELIYARRRLIPAGAPAAGGRAGMNPQASQRRGRVNASTRGRRPVPSRRGPRVRLRAPRRPERQLTTRADVSRRRLEQAPPARSCQTVFMAVPEKKNPFKIHQYRRDKLSGLSLVFLICPASPGGLLFLPRRRSSPISASY